MADAWWKSGPTTHTLTLEDLIAAYRAEGERQQERTARRIEAMREWNASIPDHLRDDPDVRLAGVHVQYGAPMHPDLYRRVVAKVEG